METIKAWQDAERVQSEQLDPLATVRKGLLADDTTQKLIKELTAASSFQDHINKLADQNFGISAVAEMLALQTDELRKASKSLKASRWRYWRRRRPASAP